MVNDQELLDWVSPRKQREIANQWHFCSICWSVKRRKWVGNHERLRSPSPEPYDALLVIKRDLANIIAKYTDMGDHEIAAVYTEALARYNRG